MLARKVRVISFFVELPSYPRLLSYFLESWKKNYGELYDNIEFTILLTEPVSHKTKDLIEQLSEDDFISFQLVSQEKIQNYGNYWPLSFLDTEYSEDVLVFSSPHSLLVGDISSLVDKSYCDSKLIAPKLVYPEGLLEQELILGEFLLLPRPIRTKLKNKFLSAMVEVGGESAPLTEQGYYEAYELNARTWHVLIERLQLAIEVIPSSQCYVLCGGNRELSDYSEVSIFTIPDAPDIKYPACTIFNTDTSVERFLHDYDLSGAWLYFQRELRRLHSLIFPTVSYDNFVDRKSYHLSRMSPYYIYVEGFNYKQQSAGIRALHYLCHALNEIGAEAYLLGNSLESSELRTPVLKLPDIERHKAVGLEPFVIYPEVVTGNPLDAPNVVRWLLNKPGFLGGDEKLNSDELIYAFTQDYIPEDESNIELLTVPIVDGSVFNNRDNEFDEHREGVYFYANKYLAKGGKLTKHIEGAKSLGLENKLTHMELAEILRKAELLYCYEPSAIIRESLLCGCPVVMIPNDLLEENLSYPISGPGIAESPEYEEIEQARKTVHLVSENDDIFIEQCWSKLKTFVNQTQEHFSRSAKGESKKKNAFFYNLYEYLSYDERKTRSDSLVITKSAMRKWLSANTLSESRISLMAERMMTQWSYEPTFHLLMIVNAHELSLLPETFDALENQLYKSWGLTILSDIPAPEAFDNVPANIEWVQVEGDLNDAIDFSVNESGLDWILQLLPGDKLEPHALLSFAETSNLYPNAQLLYSDEVTDIDNYDIWFKPDFNLELLRSQSYLGRSVVVSRTAYTETEGFSSFAYVTITDMAFKVYERYGAEVIKHIPQVLLQCYTHEEDQGQRYLNETLIRQGHLKRSGIDKPLVDHTGDYCFKMHYPLDYQSQVSIVIVNKDNASHVSEVFESIKEATLYDNYEIILVDQKSEVEDVPFIYDEAIELFGEKFKLFSFEQENYAAAVNFGVSKASGEYIVIAIPAISVIDKNWLPELISLASLPDVAVVGPRIIDQENRILHAGGVLGLTDDREGVFARMALTDNGYMNRLKCVQEYPAVGSTCFMTTKVDFEAVAGLDTGDFNDTAHLIEDFCLKQQARAKRVVWTPFATICQHRDYGSDKDPIGNEYLQGIDAEKTVLSRWETEFSREPAFNPNLSLYEATMLPELKLLTDIDNRFKLKPRVMVYPFNQGAIGYYRVLSPIHELARQGLIEVIHMPTYENRDVKTHMPNLYELNRWKPDVILMHLMLQDDHYDFLCDVKENTNIKLVFGIDDFIIQLPKKSSVRREFAKDLRHRLRRTLKLCDRLLVSTPPLADAYKDYHDDIVIVPNSLSNELWGDIIPTYGERKTAKPRVGWVGGSMHHGDLEVIFDTVIATHEQIDWVFMGMCPDEIKPYVAETYDVVPLSDYPTTMATLDLDLALAPLEVHPFNACKSNLRLLEYGMMGWPVICSDIEPFRENNPPVRYVEENTAQAWKAAVLDALTDIERLQQEGYLLKQWVRSNYLLEQHLSSWLQAIDVK